MTENHRHWNTQKVRLKKRSSETTTIYLIHKIFFSGNINKKQVLAILQKTSKEIDAIEVSDCLAPAKEAHKIYMQERINLIIQFMNGNDNVTEYEGLNKGDKSILEYSLIMLRCTK